MIKKLSKSWFLILLFWLFSPLYANLRDPTKPELIVQNQITAAPVFVLAEIIFSPTRKIAVINGKYLKLGDFILGERIVNITEKTVQLEGADGKITLFLIEKKIKKLSSDGF